MEQYKVLQEMSPEIKFGYYTKKIHDKHINSFGQESASKTLSNVTSMFEKLSQQVANHSVSNNTLLVGQVQSGKTANLELLTAIAFDNGYNLLIIYGGYDDSLLEQTTKRFKKTFDCPDKLDYDGDYPAVFTTAEDKDFEIEEETFGDLISCKPVIMVSMKRPVAMQKINDFLKKIETDRYRPFIIDDEGDQASLNTAKDKKNGKSATYEQIVTMKRILNDPLYCSVTATPQANIYLPSYSALRPDSIHLIWPGKGYSGAQEFHLKESDHIVEIDDIDDGNVDLVSLSKSLRMSIGYFVVACAMKMMISGEPKKCYGDMIIHTVREVSSHKGIYTNVYNFLQKYKDAIKNNSDDLDLYYEEIEKVYNDYLSEELKNVYSFDSLKDGIREVLLKVAVILKNSKGKDTQGAESLKRFKIYIGADLLQRGLTFENLVTTYFTRWAKSGGNMDTTLQRARWFGYRQKYISLCKMFTTQEIEEEFVNLAEIDQNIWDQFYEVENGDLDINDIVIPADKTKLSPTNKNKTSYKKLKFKMKWQKQQYILTDKKEVKKHNKLVDSFINCLSWENTHVANLSGGITATHAEISVDQVKNLLSELNEVVSSNPSLDIKSIESFVTGKAHIFQMQFDGRTAVRSLYPETDKIKALQEGRRGGSDDKLYKGDSHVILDENDHVNLQIYKIRPCYKDSRNGKIVKDFKELEQYVFALYVPVKKTVFVAGE